VVSGESLETVARDYHVSPSEIAFVNQLEPGNDLSSTDSLVIPVPPAPSGRSRLTLYRVEHGDTLVTVADRFNITVQQLRRWNHLTAARLVPGHRLYVAEPALLTSSKHPATASKKHAGAKTGVAQSTPAPKAAHTTANNSSSSTSHPSTESVSLNR
jgi:membrane-bound lytic murein transglycosylase D